MKKNSVCIEHLRFTTSFQAETKLSTNLKSLDSRSSQMESQNIQREEQNLILSRKPIEIRSQTPPMLKASRYQDLMNTNAWQKVNNKIAVDENQNQQMFNNKNLSIMVKNQQYEKQPEIFSQLRRNSNSTRKDYVNNIQIIHESSSQSELSPAEQMNLETTIEIKIKNTKIKQTKKDILSQSQKNKLNHPVSVRQSYLQQDKSLPDIKILPRQGYRRQTDLTESKQRNKKQQNYYKIKQFIKLSHFLQEKQKLIKGQKQVLNLRQKQREKVSRSHISRSYSLLERIQNKQRQKTKKARNDEQHHNLTSIKRQSSNYKQIYLQSNRFNSSQQKNTQRKVNLKPIHTIKTSMDGTNIDINIHIQPRKKLRKEIERHKRLATEANYQRSIVDKNDNEKIKCKQILSDNEGEGEKGIVIQSKKMEIMSKFQQGYRAKYAKIVNMCIEKGELVLKKPNSNENQY